MPTRSLFVVNLYQTDTGLVVLAGNDRGVWTGRQTDRDRGFEVVGRSQSIAADQRGLACVTLPVVVRREERAICVAQLQSRIGKGIGDAELLERRTEGADGNASRADFVAGDESPNQHIGAGPDLRAGANIGEPGIGSLITGSASGPDTPKLASEGPIPRTPTRFGPVPVIMNPLIATPSPISTRARPEMFNACAGRALIRKTCPPEPRAR